MNGFHLKVCRLLLFATALTTPVAAQPWKAPTTMKKLPNGLDGGGLRRSFCPDLWCVRQLWNRVPFRAGRTHRVCSSVRAHDV